MRPGVSIVAAISLAALCAGPGVGRAYGQVGASGTWLSISGSRPRSYMTYGHAEEPELYAPIGGELARLGVRLQPQGDNMLVLRNGQKLAEWPIVHARENVPETGEPSCVLLMGGNTFVPVRAVAALLNLDVTFDQKRSLVALVPGTGPAHPPVAHGPDPFAGEATLSGIQIEQSGGSIVVRVAANHAVRPTILNVNSPAPARIVFDFPHSHWAAGVTVPQGLGEVRKLRIGTPDKETARLVLEVPSSSVKVTGLLVNLANVQATIGLGGQVAEATLSPEVEAAVKAFQQPVQQADAGNTGAPQPPIDTSPLDNVVPAENLVGKTICLDAGHGGTDPGAPGASSWEKDLCLGMCRELRKSLEKRGAKVIMTRSQDVFVSLEERCQIANNSRADLFISIHLNSMPHPNTASGSETYFHTPVSVRLARALHSRLIRAVRDKDGGIRNRRFYVVRNTQMPSVLLEIAYINNTSEEQLLKRPGFSTNLAESLTAGVLDYFGKEVRSASGR